MSTFYSDGVLHQDVSRVLTPWNYLSVSPVPTKPQRTRTQLSSDSTRTLLDTPSPHSLAFSSRDLSRTPIIFEPDTENVLHTPFEKHFGVSFSPAWLQPLQEISPVVRASSSQDPAASSPSAVSVSPPTQPVRKPVACPDHVMHSSDFEEDTGFDLDDDFSDADAEGEEEEESGSDNAFLRRLHSLGPDPSPRRSSRPSSPSGLQSPCKIQPMVPSSSLRGLTELEETDCNSVEYINEVLTRSPISDGFAQLKDPPKTPEQPRPASPPSPLTPLTPLSPSTSLGSPVEITTVLRPMTRNFTQKRKLDVTFSRTLSMSPKRPRLSLRIPPRSKSAVEATGTPSSPLATATTVSAPVFTSRTFPPTIEISPKFPLFYRRYPISSYFQPPLASSPFTLLNVRDPGGIYNPPRSVFDLYTPRFVKGKGIAKLGLCPICIEPCERGGENRKNWLAMKFSAFKCSKSTFADILALIAISYHMQYAHGISAATGRPFAPPSAFQLVTRPNAGKKEKTQILNGRCQKCRKWVPVEGIKDVESKVKELVWWKHAASCYQDTPGGGDEHDFFEKDAIFAVTEEYYVP